MRSTRPSPLMSEKPQNCVDRSMNCGRVCGVMSPVGWPCTHSPTPHRLGLDSVNHWAGISVARSLTATVRPPARICTGAENGYDESAFSPPLSNGPARLYTASMPVTGSATVCVDCPSAVVPPPPATCGLVTVSVSFTPPTSLNTTSTYPSPLTSRNSHSTYVDCTTDAGLLGPFAVSTHLTSSAEHLLGDGAVHVKSGVVTPSMPVCRRDKGKKSSIT